MVEVQPRFQVAPPHCPSALEGEQLRARALGGNPRSLGRDRGRIGQVTQHLPADRRIASEQPGDDCLLGVARLAVRVGIAICRPGGRTSPRRLRAAPSPARRGEVPTPHAFPRDPILVVIERASRQRRVQPRDQGSARGGLLTC
ncbi:MAG: hypothetical protein U0841_02055 [Chloroflexia bacterium]